MATKKFRLDQLIQIVSRALVRYLSRLLLKGGSPPP